MQLMLYPSRNAKQCLLLPHFLLGDDRPGATSGKVAIGTASDWLCAVSGIYRVREQVMGLPQRQGAQLSSYDTSFVSEIIYRRKRITQMTVKCQRNTKSALKKCRSNARECCVERSVLLNDRYRAGMRCAILFVKSMAVCVGGRAPQRVIQHLQKWCGIIIT